MKEQAKEINQVLRGHYTYYGLGGNSKSLLQIYYITKRYWYKMLCSRSWRSYIKWERLEELMKFYPLQQPKVVLPYEKMASVAVL